MVFRMCVNQPPTGGRKGPLNSQTQKLAVGAPTGISWAPRAHGGQRPRAHEVSRNLLKNLTGHHDEARNKGK